MNLDFSDDQKALQAQVRRYLDAQCPPEAVRRVLEGSEPIDRKLWAGLAGLGVQGLAIPEAYGGSGLGDLELCVASEELGRSLAPVPFSASIGLAAAFVARGGSEAQKSTWLPALASGAIIGVFAYAEAPGPVTSLTVRAIAKRDRLTGEKIAVTDGGVGDLAVVAARDGTADGPIALYLVDLRGDGVERSPEATIDPTRGHARLKFSAASAERIGDAPDSAGLIASVLDRAAVLQAFEQVGGADRALSAARDYALERMAFGRQIGSYQAVKHLLADMYVSATLARSNAYYGAWALSADSPALPLAAATARVSGTRAFLHCAKNNMHVHGGMGFTWAFDCHLLYRRATLLSVSLGGLSEWEARLVTGLRRTALD